MKQNDHITQQDRIDGSPTESAPARTFVISDAHGCPELITGALEHGGFRLGIDAFVYAGDFVDRGPDALGCLAVIERYATEVLVGNHELAVLLGFPLFEQTRESRALRQVLLDRALSTDPAIAWKAVTSVDGVLISHGGIAERYESVFHGACEASPERLADHLNERFVQAVREELETGAWDADGIVGERGPLWFRPHEWAGGVPLRGVTQVVGHTPPIPELEEEGFFMVDPCAFWSPADERQYRYALIEAGRVQIVEGPLKEASSCTSPEESAPLAVAG
ncbi:MAG: metallophosphoesterase [Thermoleophilia bacterium]